MTKSVFTQLWFVKNLTCMPKDKKHCNIKPSTSAHEILLSREIADIKESCVCFMLYYEPVWITASPEVRWARSHEYVRDDPWDRGWDRAQREPSCLNCKTQKMPDSVQLYSSWVKGAEGTLPQRIWLVTFPACFGVSAGTFHFNKMSVKK